MTAHEVFHYMDSQRDKRLTFAEFKTAMNQFDRNMSTFEIDLLFNHFDKNENGALELRELVTSLDDDSILGEFHVELLNYMNRNRMDFNDVFRRFSQENFLERENFIKFGIEIGNGRFPETKLS